MLLVDYEICVECSNPDAFCTCYKCGECGRKFENGFLVDDGGTSVIDWSEE